MMADIIIRKEASGPGWHEHFVDIKRASNSTSMGESVSKSFSYVIISHFASTEECSALIDSAADIKLDEKDNGGSSSSSSSNHILFASSANTNCDRYSVKALLNNAAKMASSAILNRLLGFLDGSGGDQVGDHPDFISLGGGTNMSNLAMKVFGCCTDLRSMTAVWYEEPVDELGQLVHPEPKVNVYSKGGYFNQHGDGMDLTLLIVLSDEFEGGGTAFYRDLDLSHDDLDIGESTNASHSFSPESIALPCAGSAMIWGGSLQHMALPVTKGVRSVYVGSFDLK